MTPMKTMLNTTKTMALTLALSLAPASLLALGAVTAVATVAAPGVASAASGTACSGASPASQLGPMTAWVYFPPAYPGGPASVTFEYGTQQEGITLPAGTNYSAIDGSWSGIDNPAPLLWYNSRYPGDLGCVEFGAGVTYTSQLTSKMESESFAPSMVGGANPQNMTVPTQSTTSTNPPTPSTSGGGTHTTKTTSVPTQSPPTTVQKQTPSTPIAPITVTTAPAGATSHELLVIQRDRQLIADGPPPVIPSQSPPQHGNIILVVVGGAVLALIVAGIIFVRRRQRPQGIDNVNSDMARKFGRRN